MYLNNYQYLKNKETYLFILLFLFSFLIRIPILLIYGDTSLENEWKVIVNNLAEHGKFSFISFDGFFVPNLFMPPLYAFYLYFFKLFNLGNETYIQTILFSQNVLSSLSVVIFYIINKFFFPKKTSIISALIFSLFPIHLYACGQISSAILQSFLIVSFFYFFFKTSKRNNFLNICFLSLTSGLLILLRGEFIVLFILSVFYLIFFLKINFKSFITIILLTIIVVSPYLIRNIILVDKITITKSIGFNLWKGNNPNADVEGATYLNPSLEEKINKVPKNKYYDIYKDEVFLNEAIKNIKTDPVKYFILYLKKFLSFVLINFNSLYPNYYHPLHYLPVLFISITSILGIVLSNKNSLKIDFLILFFIVNIAIVSTFFILPRYKLGIIPLQIIFSGIFYEYVRNRLLRK